MKQYYSLKTKHNVYTCLFVDDVIVKTKDHNIIKKLVNEKITFEEAAKLKGVKVIFNICKNFEKWESEQLKALSNGNVAEKEEICQ